MKWKIKQSEKFPGARWSNGY